MLYLIFPRRASEEQPPQPTAIEHRFSMRQTSIPEKNCIRIDVQSGSEKQINVENCGTSQPDAHL